MNNLHPLVPSFFSPEWIVAGFTTRLGGVSLPPFDSLNLGTSTADNQESVQENYRILYTHLEVTGDDAALMSQIHGTRVRVVDRGGLYPDTDCLLTSEPGVLLGVRTADCVPLLLHDPRKGTVGAVHCGWRPISEGIIERTIGIMRSEWGAAPEDILAALGPSAGPCCYEVGTEIAELFDASSVVHRGESFYVDLHGEITLRLRAAGVSGRRIESLPHCTICNESLYFSHRRDGDRSGRMMGYILMKRGL